MTSVKSIVYAEDIRKRIIPAIIVLIIIDLRVISFLVHFFQIKVRINDMTNIAANTPKNSATSAIFIP